MTLRTLLEKTSDADLLREIIAFTAERLMALQASRDVERVRSALGADPARIEQSVEPVGQPKPTSKPKPQIQSSDSLGTYSSAPVSSGAPARSLRPVM